MTGYSNTYAMSHPTAPDFSRPAPTPLDALPDHEFWNSHRSHSISTLASSPTSLASVPRSPSIVDPPRKFSRKLPPKVTESLENLSWSTTSHSTFLPVTSYKRDKPFPSTPPGQYTLAVEAPSTEFGAIHAISPPSTRKASSSSTSSGPTESSSTMSIRTPYSSQVYSRPSFSSHASPLSCSSGSASACGSWSVLDEIESSERAAAARKTRESRKEKKVRKAAEDAAFDVDTPPHVRDLFEASQLEVIDEDGEKVRFGDLVRQRRTIVIFIRHCQSSSHQYEQS